MDLPYFDESNLPGSLWSTIVTVLRPDPLLPQPTYIGERVVNDPNYRLQRSHQKLDWVTLKICLGGRGFMQCGKQRHSIHPGQAILFCTKERAFIHGTDKGADHFHFCRFTFSGMNEQVMALNKRYGYLFTIPEQHSLVQRIFSYKSKINNRLSMQASEAAELVWSVLSSCMHLFESALPDNALTRECLEWINRNIESGGSIADCAEALQVSQEHLTRVFQSSIGQTPGAFLLQERLRHALHLLLNTKEPIKAIAVICAYKHASHFSRAFRDRFGVSPRSVRQNPEAWSVLA